VDATFSRTALGPAAALLLLLLGGGVRAEEDPTLPRGKEAARESPDARYPPEFRDAVNAAIERGKAHLLASQREDGTWPGMQRGGRYALGAAALGVLTLLACGVPPTDAAVTRAFETMRPMALTETYSVAVLLMALAAKYETTADPFAEVETDRYGASKTEAPCEKRITPQDLAWMREGVAFLLENQNADGVWRYPSGGFDLSNTQFALLGLYAATRCGLEVPQRVWLDALRHVLSWQEQEGPPVMYKANEVRGRYRIEWLERAFSRGFGYSPEAKSPTGSMTTAGLACLYICQARLWKSRAYTGELRDDTARGIRDAVAWLQEHFTVSENPGGPPHWHLYYLYGLERAGVIGRFRFLGTTDWYREGAEEILSLQAPNGAFQGPVDTCFALLFLKRAALRMEVQVVTPRADGEPAPAPPAPTRRPPPTASAEANRLIALGRWLKALADPNPDAAFEATIELGRMGDLRASDELCRALRSHKDTDVRGGAAAALGSLPSLENLEALVAALGDPEPVVRGAADASLRRLTGHMDPAPAVAEDHNGRVRLQKEWRAWVAAHAEALGTRWAAK